MVLTELQLRSLQGVLMAIARGSMIYHGATSDKSITDRVSEATGINQTIKVEKTVALLIWAMKFGVSAALRAALTPNFMAGLSNAKTVTINKLAEELYNFWHNFFWHNFENLPVFMKHLKSVTVWSETRSHWIASAPVGQSVEWDAEIIKDAPNHFIAWASVAGADVENSGFMRFQPAPGDRGTEVKVVMEYAPPGGALTVALVKLFGEEPEQQIGDELRRFKQLMETGEIATIEGQPSCR